MEIQKRQKVPDLRKLCVGFHTSCTERLRSGHSAIKARLVEGFSINGEPEEQLLHDARNGNIDGVRTLLASCKKGHVTINLDCKGRKLTLIHFERYGGHTFAQSRLILDVKVKSMLCFCTSHHYDW
ncbi:unnamed protein product [Ranitomeya imitator]|uniref:Uncharacterized protein n=1 Tax=Ranitomeya imitator TaxID=111125 RepID=A0ABN9MMV7_9NEOB|nr:unnamed protein product [Ranitomeya imitator]